MKKPISGPIDPFALAPLLSVLPARGKTERLESFAASFFARYEKVRELRAQAVKKESERQCAIEEAMLRQVLDWLAINPEAGSLETGEGEDNG